MISDMLVSSTMPPHHKLIQDPMYLVHVKDEVKLADILKALVQSFNKNLNEVQDAEFRLTAVNTENKIESGVVTIDQLVVRSTYQRPPFEKVANIVVSLGDKLEGLLDDLLLL